MTEFFGERQLAAVLKHEIVSRYLPVFVNKTGTTSWDRRVAYVDGFAGPGKYDDGSEGSPAVAVRTAATLAGFKNAKAVDGHLVEQDRDSCVALRNFVRGAGLDWVIYEGDVREHLPRILEGLHQREAGFFFLDPFGLGVPFDMLEQIMQRAGPLRSGYRTEGAATEILLNFSMPGLWRNAGHLTSTSDDVLYNAKTRWTFVEKVNAAMGGDWWQPIWRDQPSGERDHLILDGYIKKLLKLAGGHVWAIPCADRWGGSPSYWLVHLTQHPDGMWEFHEATSNAMEAYRAQCFASAPEGLFSADEEREMREDEWVRDIEHNIERLLVGKSAFVVQDEMHAVFGHTVGFARAKHVRKAVKNLHRAGKTITDGKGDVQTMRVRRA